MVQQRKYLDSKRRVPLAGRPIYPQWNMIMEMGIRAVEKGWADESPYLSDVMWDGIRKQGICPQPAAFCNPLLREWLEADESPALDFLRTQWNNVRAPESVAEASEMLAVEDCISRGYGHRLRMECAARETLSGAWAAGWCSDCVSALLWRFDNAQAPGEEMTFQTWPFYDHEVCAPVEG